MLFRSEAELGATYISAREGAIFRQTLHDMGHPQVATPVTTDGPTARAILDNTMTGWCLKGAGERGMPDAKREAAQASLAHYPAKKHTPTHHHTVRPIYTHQDGQSPAAMQGRARRPGSCSPPSRQAGMAGKQAKQSKAAIAILKWLPAPKRRRAVPQSSLSRPATGARPKPTPRQEC